MLSLSEQSSLTQQLFFLKIGASGNRFNNMKYLTKLLYFYCMLATSANTDK